MREEVKHGAWVPAWMRRAGRGDRVPLGDTTAMASSKHGPAHLRCGTHGTGEGANPRLVKNVTKYGNFRDLPFFTRKWIITRRYET
jgi:hypothetical protein